ncbi:uncharacterized protein C8R40DRAFT_1110520 [Lentinula edodes]|uniref:uncharacterized protein n=1 Tax=Lentinula edodes TaxID=5353 RepID=UPI001E8D2676|nr:uncharacterized protein C8R40DRAFT_1110520 [Lentinula edodes]KAH7873944.1 hypothetical protein C8R40DRAFT_1110520 [Lentinula edodes]KAJ3920055.1 hypothetical protein F5877DRAFT_77530 [Lentinula edodes]
MPTNMRTIALAAFLASATIMASALPTDGQMHQARAAVVKMRQQPAPNSTETTTTASTTPTSTSDSASCGVSDIFDCVKGLEKTVTSCATAASDWGADISKDKQCLEDAESDIKSLPSQCLGCVKKYL